MKLKPITYKRAYENSIANKIIIWLYGNFFQECFAILKNNTVENAQSILSEEIISGDIFYQDGVFYSIKSRFTNATALELEKIGAVYFKHKKGYVISRDKLPAHIVSAIDIAKANTARKALAIQTFLANQLNNLSELQKKLIFDSAVNAIMLDLQDRVYKNARQYRIELITPKLDDFTQEEIARRYTENLNFWIKGWTEEKIIKMREAVGVMAINGKGSAIIAEYLQKEFGIAQRKAQFLARNETAIATSSYLTVKYESEGFTEFEWITTLDGRERPLHHEYNGKIFRFDNPPIIDERTGQRGLPSQTYNCRCSFSPIINQEWVNKRRELFNKNRGL